MTAEQKATRRAYLARKKAEGICHDCLSPVVPGRASCARHLKYQREKAGRLYRKDPLKFRIRQWKRLGILDIDQAVAVLSIETCQLCGRSERLHVDHCHKTGRVRGRLCSDCNNGIGLFKDSAEVLCRAAIYLCRANATAPGE